MQNPKGEGVTDNAAAVVSGSFGLRLPPNPARFGDGFSLEYMPARYQTRTFLCSDKGLKHGLQKLVHAVPAHLIIAVASPEKAPTKYSSEVAAEVLRKLGRSRKADDGRRSLGTNAGRDVRYAQPAP